MFPRSFGMSYLLISSEIRLVEEEEKEEEEKEEETFFLSCFLSH